MTSKKDPDHHVEHLILGAGPAGLQLGYFMQQTGREYLILEAGESVGTFFRIFPRHRTLISINKRYTGFEDPETNLRWDWNSLLSDDYSLLMRDYTRDYFPPADAFVDYLDDYQRKFDLAVKFESKAVSIRKDDRFEVEVENGEIYTADKLIVATGLSKPYVPDIPGIELSENYTDVTLDAEDFANQRVLILGKGNSGFETADHLVGTAALIHVTSPEPVQFAWQTHFVGHLRAINNNLLDTYQLKSQNALLDADVLEIKRREDGKLCVWVDYAHVDEKEELVYDRVIACTGFRFDASPFEASCKPALTDCGKLPLQTCEWESTNVEDLYFAGVVTQMRDYKKSTSAFIHGFRYNARALNRILGRKYYGEPWASRRVEPTPAGLMEAVIERVNQSSALWQQFGFLCDLLVVPQNEEFASYLEEVPVDYVHEKLCKDEDVYYTITLEYGPQHKFKNPFIVERMHREDVGKAHESNFLHPVVRRCANGRVLQTHHVIEDLEAAWNDRPHKEPLLGFFKELATEQGHRYVAT